MNNIKLYSVVTFKEYGHTGNTIKGVVTNINGNTITVDDFDDNIWTMSIDNVTLSGIFSEDKVSE